MLSRVLLPTLLLLLLPCPATPRLKGTRPGPPHGPLRPGAICRPREGGGSAAAAAAAPWHHGCPGPALTAHPSDELHSSRGHQWGNGLVPDQMLRALLQVDGVLSARDGCQVKRPPLLCRNPRCFCGTSLFLCTTGKRPPTSAHPSLARPGYSPAAPTPSGIQRSPGWALELQTTDLEHKLSSCLCSSAGHQANRGVGGTANSWPVKGMLDASDQM